MTDRPKSWHEPAIGTRVLLKGFESHGPAGIGFYYQGLACLAWENGDRCFASPSSLIWPLPAQSGVNAPGTSEEIGAKSAHSGGEELLKRARRGLKVWRELVTHRDDRTGGEGDPQEVMCKMIADLIGLIDRLTRERDEARQLWHVVSADREALIEGMLETRKRAVIEWANANNKNLDFDWPGDPDLIGWLMRERDEARRVAIAECAGWIGTSAEWLDLELARRRAVPAPAPGGTE